jgi:hypothetical protein
MLREGGVAVVERQQKRASCVVRGASDCKLLQRQGTPPRPRQRGHLPRKDGTAHARHAELERAADAVVAEDWGNRQCGHIHVNTAQVTSAKTSPSNVDFSVNAQARRYQIDICHSASV